MSSKQVNFTVQSLCNGTLLMPYNTKKGFIQELQRRSVVLCRWGKIVFCNTYHAEHFVNKQTKITALKRRLTAPQRQYDQHCLKY